MLCDGNFILKKGFDRFFETVFELCVFPGYGLDVEQYVF